MTKMPFCGNINTAARKLNPMWEFGSLLFLYYSLISLIETVENFVFRQSDLFLFSLFAHTLPTYYSLSEAVSSLHK